MPDEAPRPAGDELAPRPRRRRWMWLLLAGTLAFHVTFIISTSRMIEGRRTFVLFDDAAISMRYAENLADGHGLVWNPGETPVEGITNPLWALWMAVLHLVFPLPRPLATLPVMATSSVLLLACVVLAARVARQLAPELRAAPAAAAVLTATAYPLAFWSLRGMEVGAVAAAALAALTLALSAVAAPPGRRPALHGLGALLLAMVAARLDAAVLAVPLAAWCVWRIDPAHRRRALAVLGGWLVLGVVAMTAARLAYYGEVVPNTYYLKGTGVPLDTKLHFGFWTLGKVAIATLVAPLAATAGGVAWMIRHRRGALVALPVALVLLQAAYDVWAGGDAWEAIGYANRYISTVLPLLAVLAGVGIGALVAPRSPQRRPALLATAVMGGAGCLAFAAWGERHPFNTAGVVEWGANRGALVAGGVVLLIVALVTAVRRPHRAQAASVIAPSADPGLPADPGAQPDAGSQPDTGAGAGAGSPPEPEPTRPTGEPAPARARRGAPVLAGALVVAAVVAANAQAVLEWHRYGAAYVSPDAGWTRDGVIVAACTDPGTTVGVFAAGQIIYYSGRPGIDLLGKSDPVVARVPPPPRTPYRPGHNKYSYEWSVGTLRPDLITDTGTGLVPDDLRRLAEQWGYEPINKWMIRRDAEGIDRDGLRRALDGEQGACTGDGGDGWPKSRY